MLIAMTLTLILITAIAQFYAIIGASVKDGRATIEMGGRLRAAVSRLKADLEQITVTVAPWTDDGSASGYFEYFEGVANDFDANGNRNLTSGSLSTDAAEDLYDPTNPGTYNPLNFTNSPANGVPDYLDFGVTSAMGDGDDFLAFTIRSPQLPFTGRYCSPSVTPPVITSQPNPAGTAPVIINSQLAEVVWWVGFDDTNSNVRWDFDEPRHLYRRQLLIRPDLGQIGADFPGTVAGWTNAQNALMRFWQYNDISASIRGEFGPSGPVYRIRANSLSDLARRENRFAHMPVQVAIGGTAPNQYLVDALFPHSAVTQSTMSNIALLLPALSQESPNANALTSYALQSPSGANGENPGEDVMLSDLLAFDVQAYDPYARIWTDSIVAIVPSDPGYDLAARTAGTTTAPLGVGAYVDLNYMSYLTLAAQNACNVNSYPAIPLTLQSSHFGPIPATPKLPPANYPANFGYSNTGNYLLSHGATYDTWALSYERDGVDQSGTGSTRPDLATNGLDDDGVSGVDDIGERDTAPPYSQPLRGIQVRIRLYEPSTRQVRQATVAMDFVTE